MEANVNMNVEAIEAWANAHEKPVDAVLAAMAAYVAGDPDAPAEMRIRSAWRDIGCRGSGPEAFRRVRYPSGVDGDEGVWPDGDRLPALGVRASERHASVSTSVPVGTIVAQFDRTRFQGRGGKCRVTFALVGPADEAGRTRLFWLEHRTLRSRPVYEIALPDGTTTTWKRREA